MVERIARWFSHCNLIKYDFRYIHKHGINRHSKTNVQLKHSKIDNFYYMYYCCERLLEYIKALNTSASTHLAISFYTSYDFRWKI